MNSFQQLLDDARSDNAVLQDRNTERQQLESDGLVPRLGGLAPRTDGLQMQASAPPISDRAIDLIVAFEVSSRTAYERLYRHPIWPKGRSGITVGIGYDVGYVRPAVLAADWRNQLAQKQIDLLAVACGVTGTAAAALLVQTHAVDIPFDNAMAVFRGVTLGQTASLTARALPNADRLHPDCFGALVSLVYNRGPSFGLQGDRYAEMRQIKEDMRAAQFAQVPGRIRAMKRLWQGRPELGGLVKRRELEAVLFEEGLAA